MIHPRLKKIMQPWVQIPVLRAMLISAYSLRNRRNPWMGQPPIDRAYGVNTSGFLPQWLLASGNAADAETTAYGGCQPSCLRAALASVPHPETRSFLDLGCGKGRGLIVASELPFRRIVGVELAPHLIPAARRNADIMRARHPERTAMEVIQGDATAAPLPDGDLVVFLYHSFGRVLVERMISRLEQAARSGGREIFLVYENPVFGDVADTSPACHRWFCRTVPCEAEERGHAFDDSETIIVWKIGGAEEPPRPEASTPIVITIPGWRANLATDLASG